MRQSECLITVLYLYWDSICIIKSNIKGPVIYAKLQRTYLENMHTSLQ